MKGAIPLIRADKKYEFLNIHKLLSGGIIVKNYVFFCDEIGENGFLSNWYESDMIIDGIKFKCVWQYKVYQKAVLFGDYDMARLILKAESFDDLKYLNRKILWFDSKIWSDRRYGIVKRGVLAKFSSNEELMKKFLELPEDSIFVKCHPFDRVWGIGLSIEDNDRFHEDKWRGLNLLGKILTEVRMELEGNISE